MKSGKSFTTVLRKKRQARLSNAICQYVHEASVKAGRCELKYWGLLAVDVLKKRNNFRLLTCFIFHRRGVCFIYRRPLVWGGSDEISRGSSEILKIRETFFSKVLMETISLRRLIGFTFSLIDHWWQYYSEVDPRIILPNKRVTKLISVKLTCKEKTTTLCWEDFNQCINRDKDSLSNYECNIICVHSK